MARLSLFFQTEYERAIECEIEGRRLASELRDGFLLLTSMFFWACRKEIWGACPTHWRRSKRQSKWLAATAICSGFRGCPIALAGFTANCRTSGALKYDQEGLEVGRQYHVLEAEANSLINLGIDYTHAGKTDETVSAFDEAHQHFRRDAWFRWRYNIRLQAATAEHWLREGSGEGARIRSAFA